MDVTREDCQKCPYEPGIICKNCDEQEKRDTKRLCHMLIDELPVIQMEKAYLLLNRLYCGAAVSADDAFKQNPSEIVNLTMRLMGKMNKRQQSYIYTIADKVYAGEKPY